MLAYRNTKLAVVEAEAWGEALTEGVALAKNYADKMSVRFTYATNGQGIYGIDMENEQNRILLLWKCRRTSSMIVSCPMGSHGHVFAGRAFS